MCLKNKVSGKLDFLQNVCGLHFVFTTADEHYVTTQLSIRILKQFVMLVKPLKQSPKLQANKTVPLHFL
jgi:hypothetical protein